MSRPTTLTARRRVLAILGATALAFGAVSQAPRADETAEAIKLVPLKWDAFKARLAQGKADKAKYTLVDAWASDCGPCKTNFPHLITMHEKYGPKGLQVISLSLDETTNPKAIAEATRFLREKKAPFLNVLLDEDYGVGFEKLDIGAIPAVFLYDAGGKEIERFTMDDPKNQFTYDQVEKKLESLFAAKTASK